MLDLWFNTFNHVRACLNSVVNGRLEDLIGSSTIIPQFAVRLKGACAVRKVSSSFFIQLVFKSVSTYWHNIGVSLVLFD